uniref:Uncharacterized protein n=1 Tax=Pyrodinium bahamense TaxID=73915 RepID=A0A7S0FM97_9DINO
MGGFHDIRGGHGGSGSLMVASSLCPSQWPWQPDAPQSDTVATPSQGPMPATAFSELSRHCRRLGLPRPRGARAGRVHEAWPERTPSSRTLPSRHAGSLPTAGGAQKIRSLARTRSLGMAFRYVGDRDPKFTNDVFNHTCRQASLADLRRGAHGPPELVTC